MRTLRAGKKSLDEKPELSGDSILEACRLKLRLESEGRTGKVFFVPFFYDSLGKKFSVNHAYLVLFPEDSKALALNARDNKYYRCPQLTVSQVMEYADNRHLSIKWD